MSFDANVFPFRATPLPTSPLSGCRHPTAVSGTTCRHANHGYFRLSTCALSIPAGPPFRKRELTQFYPHVRAHDARILYGAYHLAAFLELSWKLSSPTSKPLTPIPQSRGTAFGRHRCCVRKYCDLLGERGLFYYFLALPRFSRQDMVVFGRLTTSEDERGGGVFRCVAG
jgi:hypothetical protein